MKVEVTQSCPSPLDPVDYTACEILQARVLEWVTIPSSGHLPNLGIEFRSPALQADSVPAELTGKLTMSRVLVNNREELGDGIIQGLAHIPERPHPSSHL